MEETIRHRDWEEAIVNNILFIREHELDFST